MAITKLNVIAVPKNARAKLETGDYPIRGVLHSVICPQCLDGVSVLQIKFGSDVVDANALPSRLKEFLALHKRYHTLVGKGPSKVTTEEELELVNILDRAKAMKKIAAIIADYYDIRGMPPAAAPMRV